MEAHDDAKYTSRTSGIVSHRPKLDSNINQSVTQTSGRMWSFSLIDFAIPIYTLLTEHLGVQCTPTSNLITVELDEMGMGPHRFQNVKRFLKLVVVWSSWTYTIPQKVDSTFIRTISVYRFQMVPPQPKLADKVRISYCQIHGMWFCNRITRCQLYSFHHIWNDQNIPWGSTWSKLKKMAILAHAGRHIVLILARSCAWVQLYLRVPALVSLWFMTCHKLSVIWVDFLLFHVSV